MLLVHKNKTFWDYQWCTLAATEKGAFQTTELGVFGERAYSCFSDWISRNDKTILEAGSGTGRFCIALAKDFPNARIYGVDISKNSVNLSKTGAKLRNINNIDFIRGDIFKLPFPDDYFDVVFNEGVIEHFYNYKDSINEMVRVVRSSGKIIIAVPNWYCFPHTIYKKVVGNKLECGYEKSFRHGELIRTAKESGLKNIEIKGFYPAHGIKRLAKYSRLFRVVGKCVDIITTKLDPCTNDLFSNYFGFEIVIKGIKT